MVGKMAGAHIGQPLDVIRRNLLRSGAFPYHCPAGAVLDSGDYPRAVDAAIKEGRLAELLVRRTAHAPRAGSMASVTLSSSSRRSQTWATSRRF
jgi:hypothetical protein